MRLPFLVLLLLVSAPVVLPQNSAGSLPALPRDPREMFAAARALYDFDDAGMKPWHLKGTYQLFDENGNPGEQGTYEYWWVAPKVYRSTWTRASGTRTEWGTADGRKFYAASGDRILALEQDLRDLLVSPIPDIAKVDAKDARVRRMELKIGKVTLPCAEIELHEHNGKWPHLCGVQAGMYCFDESSPLLRVEHVPDAEYIEFNYLKKMQNRILPGGIVMSYGGKKMLAFTLGDLGSIDGNDSAVKAGKDATEFEAPDSGDKEGVQNRLVKKSPPVYPPEAKMRHITGSVLLDALIRTDGRVRDIRVVGSDSPLLSWAAKDAVAQWQYSPYLAEGTAVEMSTRIKVIFAMN
jgi:TonB family protein